MFSIYGLIDPRDYTTRYVGISRNVYQRLITHINCTEDNEQKNAWIGELKQLNLMVIMQTLGTAETYEEAMRIEGQWIRDYHSTGMQLFNKDRVPYPARTVKSILGRRSKYDHVRSVVLHYHATGQWPTDVSDDMKLWYRKFYFTRPNKKKDGAKFAMHKKSYERGRQWIAELFVVPDAAQEAQPAGAKGE